MDEEDFQLGAVQAPIDGTPLEHLCDQFPVCPPEASRYRTIDGKCNNPDPTKGLWGAAGSPMYVTHFIFPLLEILYQLRKIKLFGSK